MEKINLKKNDITELSITDTGEDSQGIGRFRGFAFFVKDALPGDVVKAVVTKVNKGYGYAKTLEIIKPSPDRVDAPCPAARRCGGCQLMELSYKRQLEIKEEKVRNNLIRLGGIDPDAVLWEPVIGMEAADFSFGTGIKGIGLSGGAEGGKSFKSGTDASAGAAGSAGGFCPLRYRNKVQLPAGRSKDGRPVFGFYAGRTHYIVETDDCPAAFEECGVIIRALRRFMEENNISVYDEKTGKGLVRHVLLRKGFATGQIMVCIVVNSEFGMRNAEFGMRNSECGMRNVEFEKRNAEFGMRGVLLAAGLNITSICINFNSKKTNVILGEKTVTIYGNPYIEDKISGLTFRISAQSFFQVNSIQTEKLYAKALEYAALTGNETVWDLYCGIGTISLFLAKKAKKVYGVEIVPQAIENAKENAKLNHIENAEFFCGKSEEVFPAFYGQTVLKDRAGAEFCTDADDGFRSGADAENETGNDLSGTQVPAAAKMPKADVVVLDPPRKGCDSTLLSAILNTEPERIVYVSCNSATLARDLKILSQKYVLEKAAPCDMFPHTNHCEVAAALSLKRNCP